MLFCLIVVVDSYAVVNKYSAFYSGGCVQVYSCYLFQCFFQCFLPSVLWRCWLGGRKGIQPVKTEWWGAGVVICLECGADLHMAQLMPLPPTVSCFSKIQIGFTFLVPAHPGSPGQRAVKRVYVFQCFDAVGWAAGRASAIWPVKNRVVGYWHGYLSGARCRLAYGPADATATHCLFQ